MDFRSPRRNILLDTVSAMQAFTLPIGAYLFRRSRFRRGAASAAPFSPQQAGFSR